MHKILVQLEVAQVSCTRCRLNWWTMGWLEWFPTSVGLEKKTGSWSMFWTTRWQNQEYIYKNIYFSFLDCFGGHNNVELMFLYRNWAMNFSYPAPWLCKYQREDLWFRYDLVVFQLWIPFLGFAGNTYPHIPTSNIPGSTSNMLCFCWSNWFMKLFLKASCSRLGEISRWKSIWVSNESSPQHCPVKAVLVF